MQNLLFLGRLLHFLVGTSLFVSAWIVIPAPNMLLLKLAVGAPEISPWLVVLNAILFGIATLQCSRRRQLKQLVLYASLAGLLLSALPLVQLPATEMSMTAAMGEGLGAEYMAQIPINVRSRMRSHPFVLADAFSGIDPGKSRHTTGIIFTTPEKSVPLSMDIYRPPQVGKYPAIVVIYGGAWQVGCTWLHSLCN
ncbi:MAG: hypothetical protein NVSMB70_13050 [Chamaesiphon sp.]